MEIIAHALNDYDANFGVPRQSGLAKKTLTRIVFTEKYREREAIRGIENYTHLWILWLFDGVKNEEWSPTVRPPKLGGNARIGVFASRSPYRPNNIGLTCVKLVRVLETEEGSALIVSGGDMKNGTPVIDVKPYIPYADCVPEAEGGISDKDTGKLEVEFEENAAGVFSDEKMEALAEILALDPRPAYQNDPEREYGLSYGGYNVRFKVENGRLTVFEIE